MQPPPRVRLNLDISLLLLLAGDACLNPGPGVCNRDLDTVNALSMQDKAPVLSDLMTSKYLNLLDITETWLTSSESSADLAEITPNAFSFFPQTTNTEERGWSKPVHSKSLTNLPQLVCLPNQSLNHICHTRMWSVLLASMLSTRYLSSTVDNGHT